MPDINDGFHDRADVGGTYVPDEPDVVVFVCDPAITSISPIAKVSLPFFVISIKRADSLVCNDTGLSNTFKELVIMALKPVGRGTNPLPADQVRSLCF